MSSAAAEAFRPADSRCPAGQEFSRDRRGAMRPVHTPALRGACRCPACNQRRAWTSSRKREHKTRMRRWWAQEGARLRGRPRKRTGNEWTEEQIGALRELLGTMDLQAIADTLNRRFGTRRTDAAISDRLAILGISRWDTRPHSVPEVARMLGTSKDRVRGWIRSGALVGMPWRTTGWRKHGVIGQAFTDAHLERFVRDHLDLLRVDRIRNVRLRRLAEVATRGRRPLTPRQVAEHVGVLEDTMRTWLRAGRIPAAWKTPGGQWRVSAADLDAVKVCVESLRARGRGRG